MIVEMDRKEAWVKAKKALAGIHKYREREVEALIDARIASHEKWWNRFRKIGLGFLFRPLSRETALHNIKSEGHFSDYFSIKLTQGRREEQLKRLIRACSLSDSSKIMLNEDDIWAL